MPQISLQPASDPGLRRACRLLSMVHELHKAGYQLLRICSGMSPAGTHWRCHITHSANIFRNGWEIVDWTREVVSYSTGDENRFLGFADGEGKSARQLAQLFIERLPAIANKSLGKDREYVGWFVEMLGAAEQGRLPIFFADYDLTPNHDEMPPPPLNQINSGSITHPAARAARTETPKLPPPNAPWEELDHFCGSYDGYADGRRSVADCAAIAARVLESGPEVATTDELRTALFFWQRLVGWNAPSPVAPEILRGAWVTIEALRKRLPEDS